MGAHSMGGSQSRCCGNGTRRTKWTHLLWLATDISRSKRDGACGSKCWSRCIPTVDAEEVEDKQTAGTKTKD